jgi:hypothetical protein
VAGKINRLARKSLDRSGPKRTIAVRENHVWTVAASKGPQNMGNVTSGERSKGYSNAAQTVRWESN